MDAKKMPVVVGVDNLQDGLWLVNIAPSNSGATLGMRAFTAQCAKLSRKWLVCMLLCAQCIAMTAADIAPVRAAPQQRSAYPLFRDIPTRWSDNDVYGHVNNVIYYSWLDTAVNTYLIEQGALDIHHGSAIGLVIESQCNYFAPLAYPQTVQAGLRVAKVGSSSVRYEVGLFAKGQAWSAAGGHFVHVYVDKVTRRPCQLPPALRAALEPLLIGRE